MDKNMEKRCRITERISLLIDNELSPKDHDAVKRHMADCSICRNEYEAVTSVNRLLRDTSPVVPSDAFARNFWKKVDAVEAKKARWSILNPLASWGWRTSLVSAAAAAVIMVAAGTIYYRQELVHKPTVARTGIPTDMLIAEDMTLYSDYEIIENLDLFENWNEINSIKAI